MESRSLAVMAVCGLVVVLLAGTVGVQSLASDRPDADVLGRLFGGTAEVASRSAMDQADLYLHAGTGRVCPGETGGHERVRAYTLPLQKMVDGLHGETAPREHKHIRGAEERELLPWFAIAARLNPRNVEAWLDGTYWYYRTGQAQEAARFITDGIRNNPSDHRVYLERGILYHRLKHYDKAATDLQTSVRLYRARNEDSLFELKAARIYLDDCRARLSEPR